jgi:hypothetical protein
VLKSLENGTVRNALGFLFHFTQISAKIASVFLSEELYQRKHITARWCFFFAGGSVRTYMMTLCADKLYFLRILDSFRQRRTGSTAQNDEKESG